MAMYSSILAWKIPGTEEPGALQFESIDSLALSLLYGSTLTSVHDHWENIDLTRWTFVSKVMSLLFNMLSRLVIVFLPRSMHLLISWLQLPSVMAIHSSTLAWKIPWMEEPGRLQSMGSLRVRHNWATSLSLFTFMHWRRKWQPTPVFLPGESQGRGSLVGCIYGVAKSRTRLKQLSSSSSSVCLMY